MMSSALAFALVAGLASFAPVANASVRTITFDDLPTGSITSAYHSEGVDFGLRPDGGVEGNSIIVSAPGSAHSGTQALWLGCGVEICPAHSWAQLTSPSSTVSAYVGSNNTGAQTATMEAYDLNGNLLTSTTANVGASENTLMSVNRPEGDIWFVHITGGASKYIYIDDLSFDVPDAPPVPDFGLATADTSGVALTDGTTSLTNLRLRRVNGSAGPISLTTGGLPTGVSATLSPTTTSGGDGSIVALRLTAAAGAPPVSRASVTVTGTPASGASGPQPRSVVIPTSVGGDVNGFDVRVKGIDVTQGVQYPGFLIPSGPSGNRGSYRGVDLAQGGKTIVRVYADAVDGPSNGVPAALALSGADASGNPLPGGPLLPIGTPPPLVPGPFEGVGPAERVDPNGAYTFVLPPTWTHGKISLHADLLAFPSPVFRGDVTYTECNRPACLVNNHFGINDVDFHPVRPYTLNVLELVTQNTVARIGPLQEVFAAPLSWLPLGEGQLILRGPVAVIQNHDGDLNQQVENWWNANGHPGDAAMGVETPAPGGGGGQTWPSHSSVASASRPFTALSHELGHLLGREHASAACGGANPSKPPGPDNEYEDWPPDQQGYLQGIGLDRREQVGPSGPFRIITANPASGSKAYDFMSYCAGEGNSWISPRGWQQIITSREINARSGRRALDHTARPPHRTRAGGAGRPRRRMQVTVLVTAQGTRVSDVRRVPRGRAGGGPRSDYRLRAVAHDGRVLAEGPLFGEQVHVNGGPEFHEYSGNLPASDHVSAVEVIRDGAVVASRRRSAHAPHVRILTPRRGARIRGRGTVKVSWRGHDRDGDVLQAEVDYSADNGRKWRQIAADTNTGLARIPSSLLSRSRHARVRVMLSDGFNERSAVSGQFRAAGRPPSVSILSPSRNTVVRADATLLLAGSAMDDRFDRIGRHGLRWFNGHRLIGRGTQIAITGALKPGRRRIRLVARDQQGRTGSASIRVRVRAVAPRVLMLRAPRHIRAGATHFSIRIRASVPAQLKMLHLAAAVGRRARVLRFRVHRGHRPLHLNLRLRAGRQSAVFALKIRRKH